MKYIINRLIGNHKKECPDCLSALSYTEKNIILKEKKKNLKYVNEKVLFCNKCNKCFITTKILEKLQKKYTKEKILFSNDCATKALLKNANKKYNNNKTSYQNAKLYLCATNRTKCTKCNNNLIKTKSNSYIYKNNGEHVKNYPMEIFYCKRCHIGYIDKVSTINYLKHCNKIEGCICNIRLQNSHVGYDKKENKYVFLSKLDRETILQSPVLLIDDKNYYQNICPNCNLNIIKKDVNIPLLDENGDVYCHYKLPTKYCFRCHKGLINKKTIISILIEISKSDINFGAILDNASIYYNKSKNKYEIKKRETGQFYKKQVVELMRKEILTFDGLLTNNPSFYNDICPICNNILIPKKANIPVLKENGDFYHYYVREVKYCENCLKWLIDQKSIINDLINLNQKSSSKCNLKFKNVCTYYDDFFTKYLYIPCIENDNAIFLAEKEYYSYKNMDNDNYSENMYDLNNNYENLRQHSFLNLLGYSTNLSKESRQKILYKATILHGKRKVTDHIAWLIRSRIHQKDGEIKFKNAISIWQKDLDFVSKLNLY